MSTVQPVVDADRSEHSGIGASWCDVCGSCTCPRNEDGEIEYDELPPTPPRLGMVVVFLGRSPYRNAHYDDACPIHGIGAHPDLLRMRDAS